MKRIKLRLAVVAMGLACCASHAHADYVSQTYQLDQSSRFGSGTTWGTVQIEAYDGKGSSADGLAAGQVRITLTADPLPSYKRIGKHFGIDGAGFNTDLKLQTSQISIPAHWVLRTGRFMGGFGQFAWAAVSRVRASHDPLVITVNGLGSDATVGHFLIPSTNAVGGTPIHGSVFFAARIAGFSFDRHRAGTTTQVVGDGYPTPPPTTQVGDGSNTPPPVVVTGNPPPAADSPEPSTLLLCVMGAGGIGVRRWLKRRQMAR